MISRPHNPVYDEKCGHCDLPIEPANNEESCECDDRDSLIAWISATAIKGNHEDRTER